MFFIDVVVIKSKRERNRECIAFTAKKRRTVKTSRCFCRNHLVGRPGFTHKRARAHTERQTALLLPSVRPCKKRKITMMMIYEKERKKENSKNNDLYRKYIGLLWMNLLRKVYILY